MSGNAILISTKARIDERVRERTVQVTSGLDGVVSEAQERVVRLVVTTLANKPTRRLWAVEHLDHDDKSRNTSRSQHQSPVETLDVVLVRDVEEREVHDVTQHDTESRPHLPVGNKAALVSLYA